MAEGYPVSFQKNACINIICISGLGLIAAGLRESHIIIDSSLPGATGAPAAGQGVWDKRLMWCINLGSKVTVVREVNIMPGHRDKAIFLDLRTEYLKSAAGGDGVVFTPFHI